MQWLTGIREGGLKLKSKRNKIQQAGAELCQAQVKLGLQIDIVYPILQIWGCLPIKKMKFVFHLQNKNWACPSFAKILR